MTDALSFEAKGLACRRDDRLLFSDLGFTLGGGDILEVCGRNGSGKTTLLRTLCGLRQADDGEITWQGQGIHRDTESYRRALCYVGHRAGLKDDLSPYGNLRAEAQLFGADPDKVEPALLRLGLENQMDLPCGRLSAGQKQRTALARLLVRDAQLWILDEPCASLDRQAQAQVQGLLAEHAERGGLVIFTTHQTLNIIGRDVQQLWLGEAADA